MNYVCGASCETSLLKLCKKHALSLLSATVRFFFFVFYEKLQYLQFNAREAIKNDFAFLLFLENCIISVTYFFSRVTRVLYILYVSSKELMIISIFSNSKL